MTDENAPVDPLPKLLAEIDQALAISGELARYQRGLYEQPCIWRLNGPSLVVHPMSEPMSKQEVTRARAQIFYEGGIETISDAFCCAAWAFLASVPEDEAKAAKAMLVKTIASIPDNMAGTPPMDAP
jgi:hypothetical protein